MDVPIGHRFKSADNNEEKIQTLKVHSYDTAQLCAEACRVIHLEYLGYLTGLLHDLGKAHHIVQEYLRGEWSGDKLNHSSAGARFIWERFGKNEPRQYYRLAAQLAAVAILCHHGVRCDMYSPDDGSQPWLDKMYSANADPLYQESCEQFFAHCISEDELVPLMDKAAKEVEVLCEKLKSLATDARSKDKHGSNRVSFQFMLGLVQRFLFGALVDADWSDTARFESGEPPASSDIPSWSKLRENVENHLQGLSVRYSIDTLRREISEQCKLAGQIASPGIYRLYVPTGGGKTFSGLRYCVHAAEQIHAERIFYFAPYRSIIGQNTAHFRAALGGDSYVLEHHSDVTFDEDKYESLLPYTQRWKGVPFISTTIVQFLNTLFSSPRRNVRRFPALANSVLLFDEVQALPTCHTYLFNLAINLLAHAMGCVVILCTATQPALEQLAYPVLFSEPKDIVPDYEERFRQFKRTKIVPIFSSFSSAEFASFAKGRLQENRAILLIFNTRAVVEKVYDLLREQVGDDVHLFCLTTHLCPQHRKDIIHQIEQQLDPNSSQKLICVSTQLIEAGVDLSFDCVIRSLASLPSVAQAAGRCNRHGGTDYRLVYVIPCSEEHLEHLADLDEGRRTTERLLQKISAGSDKIPSDFDLLSPAVIQAYYQSFYEESYQKNSMLAPISSGQTLLDLFSENNAGTRAYCDVHRLGKTKFSMTQLLPAFGTAEANFHALDENTVSVVVPYSDAGQKLISQLLSSPKPSAKLLREMQHYTVGLYQNEVNFFKDVRALMTSSSDFVYILQEGYYDPVKGVTKDPLPPENLMY